MKIDYLVMLLVLGTAVYGYHGDHMWSPYLVAYAACGVMLMHALAKKFDWVVAGCFGLTMASGIAVFGPQTVSELGGGQVLSVENVTLKATFTFLLFVLGVATLSRRQLRRMDGLFALLCLVDSIFVVYQALSGEPQDMRFGLLGMNSSLNACFIAVTYPFLCFTPEPISYIHKPFSEFTQRDAIETIIDVLMAVIPIFAIFAARASVPIFALFVAFGSYIWHTDHLTSTMRFIKLSKPQKALLILLLGGFMLSIGLTVMPDFFNSTGRYPLWNAILKWSSQNGNNLALGTGPGTFFLIGPAVQVQYNLGPGNWFIWAHNDWLQTILEQGVWAFIFYVFLWGMSILRSLWHHEEYLAASLMALGAVGIFNFPMHNAAFSLFAVILVARTFEVK